MFLWAKLENVNEKKFFSTDCMGLKTDNKIKFFDNNIGITITINDNEIEIDFLIQREGHIIPVEVKSAEHTRARSLDAYIRKFQPKYAIKICGRNFGFENGMRTVPLYAVSCLSGQY